MDLGRRTRKSFQTTDKPCLAHYAKAKCNMVTTDASKTGLGITLWQKRDNGEIKPLHSVADI